MWWYRHPSFAVTAGGSWFSRFPPVTPFFIDLNHRLGRHSGLMMGFLRKWSILFG